MEQIKINLVPGGIAPIAHASQHDVGRAIRFFLYDGENPYTLAGTETITVDVTKPDGTTASVSVTNTSGNYVDFVTTDGLLNQAGLYSCEISIVNGTDVIGSQNFNLTAEADAYGADIVTVTVGPADICTFTTTLAMPLQSVTVDLVATGGNGTPENPIPINGYAEANITANGDTVTIDFGQTVYGGKLDVTMGKLKVERVKVVGLAGTSFNAVYNGTYGSGYRFWLPYYSTDVGVISAKHGAICNMKHEETAYFGSNRTNSNPEVADDIFAIATGGDLLCVYDSDPTMTKEQFEAKYTNIEFVYPLATPFDIDLTPEVISAIVGENNVFADCGQTTVEYLKAES